MKLAAALLYLAALAGGLYSAYWPTFDSGFARIQADPGDGMLNHYLLEHTWQAVSNPNYPGTLLSPPFFYPQPLVLAYSENFLGVAPLYWALRLEMPDEPAYQWWMILCAALNFAAFAAARWLGCGHALAALAGFLGAFALVHIDQGKHQQMIPRFWMPLAVYHAWQLATVPSLRSFNRTLACAFLQAAACVYTGWFLAAALATFVPIAAAARPGGLRELGRFCAANRWRVARVVGLWGLAFAAFFTPYVVANHGIGRTYADCVEMIPTASAWLTAPSGGRWHDALAPHLEPTGGEGSLFSGFALYALFAAAGLHVWFTRRSPDRAPAMAFAAAGLGTAAVWVMLTLNVGHVGEGRSAWWVVRFLPGGMAIRCVTRVCLLVYLFGTLGGLVWLQAAIDRIRHRGLRAALLVAVAVPMVYKQTGYTPVSINRAEFYPRVDRVAAGFRGADAGYALPTVGPYNLYSDVIGMWAGLRANVPVVNGYSGRYPHGYTLIYPPDPDAAVRAWLAGKFRGRVAVVDPAEPERVRWVRIE